MPSRLPIMLLLCLFLPGSVWCQAKNPKCLDIDVALKSAARSGLFPFDLDRDAYLEQLLIDTQIWHVAPKDRIGAPVDYFCVYDVRQGGFRVENSRITELVWSSSPTPIYFICDSSCQRTFTISDTEAGIRNVNLLFASLVKPPIRSKEAQELASLASLLLKRWHPEAKKTRVKESENSYLVTLQSGQKRCVISIDRIDLSVRWLK